jgi:hypothetical protein
MCFVSASVLQEKLDICFAAYLNISVIIICIVT